MREAVHCRLSDRFEKVQDIYETKTNSSFFSNFSFFSDDENSLQNTNQPVDYVANSEMNRMQSIYSIKTKVLILQSGRFNWVHDVK